MGLRKDLNSDFDSRQRDRLADLILSFASMDENIHEHMKLGKGELFTAHRDYVAKLEDFLLANSGAEFVPLPQWDPSMNLPGRPLKPGLPGLPPLVAASEFFKVASHDGAPLPGPNPLYNELPNKPRLPQRFTFPSIGEFTDASMLQHAYGDTFPDTTVTFHVEVHLKVGGVMSAPPQLGMLAPCATAFWPYHAMLADTYHEWERFILMVPAALAAAPNQDGRLEVFAVGAGGVLWHAWQRTSPSDEQVVDMDHFPPPPVPGNDQALSAALVQWKPGPSFSGWSYWERLGSDGIRQIAVGRNQDGRLEVFCVRGDHTVAHLWQVAPNSGWSGWNSLGGAVTQIAVTANADGRLELFGVGRDGGLVHMWQTAPNNGWSGWERLGSPGSISQVTAACDDNGVLQVLALGLDGRVVGMRQDSAGRGPWHGWDRVGDDRSFQSITLARHADGHLQVFGIAADRTIWYAWKARQTLVATTWTDTWRSLGGSAVALSVGLNADGRMEVFAIDGAGKLRHTWEIIPSASASWHPGWDLLDMMNTGLEHAGLHGHLERIAVGRRQDGQLQVFGAQTGDAIWQTRQDPAVSGGWRRWQWF